jgi:hypothetical protein
MKTFTPRFLLAAALAVSATAAFAADAKPSNVSVTFHEPEKFTDVRSAFGSDTDEYYLDVLKTHLQEKAGKQLAAGQKLEITVNDVDLAGDFIPGRDPSMDRVRIVKDIFIPRIKLSFKLIGADGKVLKEGDRMLSDMNFMSNISIVGRNDPLFYDKALLSDWISKEFKS